MKIGVIGNYGARNVGDDAILTCLLRRLAGHEVTVFSANPKETEAVYGVKSVPLFPLGVRSLLRYGWWRSIRAVLAADAVVIGGGGLFQDARPFAALLWAWQVLWVRLLRKPYCFWGVGVGPLRSGWARAITRWAHRGAWGAAVRDLFSKELLEQINGLPEHVELMADPVFTYKTEQNHSERTKNVFIVSLRHWPKSDDLLDDLFAGLHALKAAHPVSFVWVNMQAAHESDEPILLSFQEQLGGEIVAPRDFGQLLELMSRAEFAVGMRYHFMLAAILTGTPLLPLLYVPKVESLIVGTVLERYALRGERIRPEQVVETLRRLSADYNTVRSAELRRAEEQAAEAEKGLRFLEEFFAAVGASFTS